MELSTIIEKSYKIFEDYTIGETLEICTNCCVTKEEEKILVRTPLRKITKEIMNFYYNSAQTYSQRELYEMKYFLPRVLELLANFEVPTHSIEISLTRLMLDKKEWWLQKEKELLHEFAIAYFQKCLEQYPLPERISIDKIIIMFGIAHFEIEKILECWKNAEEVTAFLHLKDFLWNKIEYDDFQKPIKLKNSFSEPYLDVIIVNWLRNKNVKKTFLQSIEKIIFHNPCSKEDMDELNLLYETLTQ